MLFALCDEFHGEGLIDRVAILVYHLAPMDTAGKQF